jgi:hypothetical protein
LPHTPEGPLSLHMSPVHGDFPPWFYLISQGRSIGEQRILDEGDEGRECDEGSNREKNHRRTFELSWGSMVCRKMMIVVHECRVLSYTSHVELSSGDVVHFMI